MANSKHFKNINTSLLPNIKKMFYWLILLQKIFLFEIPFSPKNGTAQMLAEISGHVKSVIEGLAMGLTGSDKYIYHPLPLRYIYIYIFIH